MRPKVITLDVADANLIGFAENVTGATWTLTTTATTDGLAHQVSIKNDTATDHSLKTAILTGTDENGNAQTETVSLPAGSATVESTKYFKTLLTVVPSATIGTDTMDIGWVDEVMSQWVQLDRTIANTVGIQTTVTGTVNYTLQDTTYDIQKYLTEEPVWTDCDDTDLVAATTSQKANYVHVPSAIKLKINSYSSGAAVALSIQHAGGGY